MDGPQGIYLIAGEIKEWGAADYEVMSYMGGKAFAFLAEWELIKGWKMSTLPGVCLLSEEQAVEAL